MICTSGRGSRGRGGIKMLEDINQPLERRNIFQGDKSGFKGMNQVAERQISPLRAESARLESNKGSPQTLAFVGERRSSGMSESRRLRRDEGYGACDAARRRGDIRSVAFNRSTSLGKQGVKTIFSPSLGRNDCLGRLKEF